MENKKLEKKFLDHFFILRLNSDGPSEMVFDIDVYFASYFEYKPYFKTIVSSQNKPSQMILYDILVATRGHQRSNSGNRH